MKDTKFNYLFGLRHWRLTYFMALVKQEKIVKGGRNAALLCYETLITHMVDVL